MLFFLGNRQKACFFIEGILGLGLKSPAGMGSLGFGRHASFLRESPKGMLVLNSGQIRIWSRAGYKMFKIQFKTSQIWIWSQAGCTMIAF